MNPFYIGIDIGTTATKGIAFTDTGKILQQVVQPYAMQHAHPNWSTQNPDEILQAVLTCIEELTTQQAPVFISFSSAMQSLLAVDANGKPLTDLILWADNRASALADGLKNSDLGESFYQSTGIPIHTFSPMTKILWLKENQPAVFARTAKFIGIKEYVWHYLTGAYVTDSSMASGTGMMDLKTLKWDENILSYLCLNAQHLPEIQPATYCMYGVNKKLLFVLGAGDGALANLGTGAMQAGKMSLTIGTSGAVRVPVARPFYDEQMRTQCYHLLENQYLVLGAVNNGAVVLQWLKEDLLASEQSYESLFAQAEAIAAGADGLLFVPYLLGERAPIWDANAKGMLVGMTINHTQAHLVRATMEGILYGLLSIAQILVPDVSTRIQMDLMASGGFAKSETWLQMAADIFQMKVQVLQTTEGSCWGAVMMGFQALGFAIKPNFLVEKTFYPNTALASVYAQQHEKFKQLSNIRAKFVACGM